MGTSQMLLPARGYGAAVGGGSTRLQSAGACAALCHPTARLGRSVWRTAPAHFFGLANAFGVVTPADWRHSERATDAVATSDADIDGVTVVGACGLGAASTFLRAGSHNSRPYYSNGDNFLSWHAASTTCAVGRWAIDTLDPTALKLDDRVPREELAAWFHWSGWDSSTQVLSSCPVRTPLLRPPPAPPLPR